MSTEQQRTSVFTCKTCKQTEEKPERKPSSKKQLLDSEGNPQLSIKLEPAKNTHMDQKYVVKVGNKTIGFGYKSMSDYTINKSDDRKFAYIARHEKRESQFWDPKIKENLLTASFWARHLLWSKQDIFDAIKQIESETGVKIKYTPKTIERHQKKLAKAVKKSGEDAD